MRQWSIDILRVVFGTDDGSPADEWREAVEEGAMW